MDMTGGRTMEKESKQWTVFWNEFSSDTYLYGTEIRFHSRDDVEFHNALMPPGTIMKTWYSMVNYQAGRIEPSLPIIDGEGSYHVSADLDCDIPGGVFLRFVFLGKNGEEAGAQIIDGPEADMKCPLKTYSYKVELVCAGSHNFHFHSFTITERTES